MITLITIMGAGQDPSQPGDLLGMRPFVQDLCQQCSAVSQFYAHDDPRLDAGFAGIEGSIVLLGHSFGGYEALRALHDLERVNRSVEVLGLMDPNPSHSCNGSTPSTNFRYPPTPK